MNMLSVVVKNTRTQTSLLAPLAAAASVGAAITSHRNVDHDDDTSERILADKPPPAVNDRWLRLRIINSTVLPGARCNIQTNKYGCCSCESPFLHLSRRETLRWLDKTSSNATLESRYKVRRCHIRSFSIPLSGLLSYNNLCKVDWKKRLGEGGYGGELVD